MIKLYKKTSFILFLSLFLNSLVVSQNACISCSNVPSFTVNLSSNPNNSYTVSSVRNNQCCQGVGSDKCVVFYVTVHPSATEIKFFKSGGNNGTYQIDCMAPTYNPTNPVCLNGLTQFCITYCNPGNNNDTYTITTSSGFSVSPSFTVSSGCTAKMHVSGLTPASVTWNSIFPTPSGAYNSYLSCLSGCDTTYVTPAAGAPAFIDYLVCGTKVGCSSGTVCDTIRVYTAPSLSVSITPTNAVICAPATSIALNANASGGVSPYSYTWTPGNVISQSVAATVGNYTVTVKDGSSGCPFKTATVSVVSGTAPPAPIPGSNSPLCAGQTLSLTASTVPSATLYSWSGPSSYTSNTQNPSIPNATLTNAGNYSVTATVGGCASAPATISVTISNAPGSPTAGSNSPICSGQNINLTANTIAGATYSWSGPNSFSSSLQNPTITGATTLAAGMYSVYATVGGCSGPSGTVNVVVNPIPVSPTLSSNSPLCVGQTLNLNASTIVGATYNWNGPNGFSSTSQNTLITNAQLVNSGNYTVTATVGGCTSIPSVLSVTIAPPPGVLSLGSNAPICAGLNLSLTASPISGATYSWSGPNAFSSSLQNPVIVGATILASGTYSAFATVGGCTGPVSTIIVTVNPAPAALILGSNSPICAGQNLNLTSNLVGSATYSWSGPNSFSSSLQNPVITSASTLAIGTYSAFVTVNGCSGPIATINVTVNPIPATPTPTNNSPICIGNNLGFTVGSVVGATYNWTGPNSFVSASQNPTIVGATSAASGSYTLTITVNGCSSAMGITIATVSPLPSSPVPGSNSPICAGQNLSLTSNTIANATYSWSGPNSFTSNIQNPTIVGATTLATGIYSVFATVNGCGGPIGTISVTINPTPISPTLSSNSPLCVGQTLNLNASNIAGATYNWNGPNGFSSTSQNTFIVNSQTVNAGSYTVTATVNGCTSAAAVITVTISPPPGALVLGSNSPVCTGQTLSLTANTIAGATYSWSGPNGFTSSLQNPIIVGVSMAAMGTYTAYATVGSCTGPINTINVTINQTPAAPVLGSNSPVCAGQNINLTASFTTNPQYLWNGPNSFTSNAQNPVINNASTLSAGIYTAVVTTLGCTSPIATINVVVNPIPATPTPSNNSPICIGNNLTFTIGSVVGATYNWSGPNSFISASQNPTIVGATSAASGSYTLTITVNGCSSAMGITIATVSPLPASPIPGSNSPICSGQNLSLTSSTIANATYSWSGPNAFTSILQNPTIVGASTLATGVYSVFANVGGCSGPIGTISVTIIPAPVSPTVSSNSPVCIAQTLSLTASTIAGATYNWSGPNSFSSANQNTVIANATTLASGIYSVFVTVNGCSGPSSTISVVISAQPTVSAGASQTVCSNNNTVALNGVSSTSSGTWTSAGTGTFSPNTINGNYVPSAVDLSNGSVVLTFYSTNNGGCSSVTNTVLINFSPSPIVNAGTSQTVCANNSTINLSGTVSVASGGIWSSNGTGTFVPNNTSLATSYIPSVADITSGSVIFTLTSTGNGNCNPVTNTMVVFITPAPVANAGPSVQIVCKNNPNYQLTGTSTTGSLTWASSGTGTFSPSSNILNPIYFSSSADTTAGSVIIIATTANNGGCNPVSTTITLVYTSTITSNAGPSQTVCSNNPNVTLTGVTTTSAGVWTSSGSGTFTPNANLLNTTYVPSATDITAGIVTLTLTTANNGGCNPVKSTMTVIINPGPIANAGSNQTVCANSASVTLSGSFAISTGAVWSSSGSGTFSPNNTNMNTTYIASSSDTTAGSVLIFLTTTGNGNCFATVDTMKITFKSAPLVNAGGNISICKGTTTVGLNGTSSTGSGTWTTIGTGSFSPSNNILNPIYTPSTADTTAGSVILILTSINNAGCNPVSNTVLITFFGNPTITAGFNATVCANNSNVNLNGSSSTNSGTWTTTGTGTFSPNAINGIYLPSAADLSAGSVTLNITSTNNGGCVAVNDVMFVNFTPAPTVIAGNNMTVCATSTVPLSGSVSIASGGIWTSSGSGTFIPASTLITTGYQPSAADTANGSVKLYLMSSGNGNCNPVVDSILVTFIKAPFAVAGNDISICKNINSVQLNGQASAGTVTWTSLGGGSFSPNSNINNPIYVPSSSDTTQGFVFLIVNVPGNANCNDASDTILVNFINAPKADFISANRCVNSVTSFSNASSSSINNWLWYIQSDTTTVLNPQYTFTNTGTYTISLVVNNGCKDSVAKFIKINPVADVAFTSTVVCKDPVRFTSTATVVTGSILSWFWNFGDSTTANIKDPIHTYSNTGTYITRHVIITDSGCVASKSDTIRVIPCDDQILIGNPAVPNIFSPNGDGKNDILYVKGGPLKEMEFRVFNEWGNQIFISMDQSLGWDGSFKGAMQPQSKYVWTLTCEVIDGRKFKMAGETYLTK